MGLSARRTSLGRFWALGLFVPLLAPLPSNPGFSSGQAEGSGEAALRARVQELYGCLQEGNWSKAETYLTESSRETFRHQDKQRVDMFQIKSVKLEKEDRAEVVVVVPASGPSAASFSVPQTTSWRLVGGIWYLELPPPDLNPATTLFSKPKNALPPRPVVQELEFKTEWFGLGNIQPGKVLVARFPFTNVSKHVVTIAEVINGCDYLRVKEQHKEYKPGESGVLEMELDSSSPALQVPQTLTVTVVVKSSPGGGLTKLTLSGIVPPPAEQH